MSARSLVGFLPSPSKNVVHLTLHIFFVWWHFIRPANEQPAAQIAEQA